MDIILDNLGRRFNRDWIFQHMDYRFESGHSYAILGPNGSGKSTLLQVIASSLSPSAGTIGYHHQASTVAPENFYRFISIAAPYIEIIEEFTLLEQLKFHFRHKNYLDGYDEQGLVELMGFGHSVNKEIRHFSSGMKQRVKLALTCCTDSPVILLDEPTTNLDNNAVEWYLRLVESTKTDRLLIVCSNQEKEYSFCDHQLDVSAFKN